MKTPEGLVSILEMHELTGLAQSTLRGYERMGLMQKYGVKVHRLTSRRYRYYDPNDAEIIKRIKNDRLDERREGFRARRKRLTTNNKPIIDAYGNKLVTVRAMQKLSGVCYSSLIGFHNMGLFAEYGVDVVIHKGRRYFHPNQALRIAQIKADREARRNAMLRSQSVDD